MQGTIFRVLNRVQKCISSIRGVTLSNVESIELPVQSCESQYYNVTSEQFDKFFGSLLKLKRPDILYLDIDYCLALQKLDEMARFFNISRFNLWQACKLTESYRENGYFDDLSILFSRSIFWQNSIIGFNHCEDYILQSVWLGLNLHKKTKNHKNWCREALKDCKYQSVIKALGEDNSINNKRILLNSIKKYHESSKLLRERVNNIKHRGLIEFSEIENLLNRRSTLFQYIGKDGEEIFNLDDLLPEVISLNDAIVQTINMCHSLRAHALFVSELFSPYNFFNVNDDGELIITSPKSNFTY